MVASAPRRIFVVGTDTDCGKTEVTCALLASARRSGIQALPFKPAASGPPGPASDPSRLVRAAGLDPSTLPLIAPLRYPEPLAPGIAADRVMFLETGHEPTTKPLERVRAALLQAEAEVLVPAPRVTLIEGAGGVHVPMPGGTWLPRWIDALAATPVVVGRLGLGTINHTLLTIDALAALGLPALGFILSQTRPGHVDDPSREHNAQLIARARGLPCLGVLPFTEDRRPRPDGWHVDDLWSRLGVATP